MNVRPLRAMPRALIVDDDRSIRRTLEKLLSGDGYEVTTMAEGGPAVDGIKGGGADVVLLDLGLPGFDGLSVLEALQGATTLPPIIVITARDDMQSTIRAMQLGAYDYLVKPLDIERLRLVTRRAIESRDASRALHEFVARAAENFQVGNIIGKSPAIREIYKAIAAVSTSHTSVLIQGESGTGKELVAKAIHYASEDRGKPFMAVNCTAFARDLLESELFGHVRGSFTGAVADKAGRFELAGGGTLFLDEVAEIPLDLQAKLLRVLQERTFERVGDARPIPLAARIVSATHRNLDELARTGCFREDLLYRLKVVEIRIPPLRERPGDIALLAESLLAKINREVHKRVSFIAADAMQLLQAYPWPGNVRELENALTRAVVLAKGEVVEAELLPLPAPGKRTLPAPAAAPETDLVPLREIERRHIARILAHTDWNKRRACALLEISRPTLDRKIEEHGLARPDRPGDLS
jgi:DNA-binding NtrC family response regulator